jgi:predicted amidohydrolase
MASKAILNVPARHRHPERDHLSSSGRTAHEAFNTPLGKVGLLICWDLGFPEAFRELIVRGAKLIIIPTFWGVNDCSKEGLGHNPNSERLFMDSTLVTRAFENTCGLFFKNCAARRVLTYK